MNDKDYLIHGYQPNNNDQPRPQNGNQPNTGILTNPPDRGSSIYPPSKDKK